MSANNNLCSDHYFEVVANTVRPCIICEKDKQILKLVKTLAFYADPDTYFAVGFFPDSPNGPIMDDFSNTDLGKKPGKLARETLEGFK